jgi:hypothetical protein
MIGIDKDGEVCLCQVDDDKVCNGCAVCEEMFWEV